MHSDQVGEPCSIWFAKSSLYSKMSNDHWGGTSVLQKSSVFHSFISGKPLHIGALIAVFLMGTFLGAWVYYGAQDVFGVWMHSSFHSAVSIVGVCLSIFFPLLITAFAVMYSKPLWIYCLCFAKAVLYSVGVFSCYGTFGNAGWLAQFLILFSGNILMVVLLTLWCHFLTTQSNRCIRAIALAAGICLCSALVNTHLIAPFTMAFYK